MLNEELLYKVAVSLLPGTGDITAKRLIAHCGGAEAVFKEKKSKLLKISGIGTTFINKLKSADVLHIAEAEIVYADKNDIDILFYLDSNYPHRLKHCEDGPIILYAKGNTNFNMSKVVSVVGARRATVMGRKFCEKLIEDLAVHQVLIVSGLAYGIDICAHKAAISNSLQTIAILGHGLEQVYPKQHTSTVNKMCENGGIASSFPHGSTMLPINFADRNRIVAGLSDAVVVIESSAKGGSLITANIANSYNRDVFAVPGRPNDEMSIGCNRLIKSNQAALIESAKDLEYILGWEKNHQPSTVQTTLLVDLTAEEQMIVDILNERDIVGIDELSISADLPMSKTTTLLLELEFKGIVGSLPGKRYKIN